MSTENYLARHIEATLALGEEIEGDLQQTQSSIIRLLAVRARQAATDAMLALIDVDASESEKIRALQNEIKRHRDIVTWIIQMQATAKTTAETISRADNWEINQLFNPGYLDPQMENDE